MDSPLVRVILATLGGYVLILFFLFVYDWILEEYPGPPSGPVELERIQHPLHHQTAVNALGLFKQLPEPEKAAMRQCLTSNLVPLEQWLARLGQSNFQILCMGELHEESTRSFLSKKFFPALSFDVLMLEATPGELKGLIKRMEAGRDYFPLLDADIMNILRTVRGRNPDIRISGIEQTDTQAENHHGSLNPRDRSIAQNFWSTFEAGSRHIVLFGALHCANEPDWLFHNLCEQASSALKNEMLNVRVLGEHQNGAVEAFVYFLDEIGMKKRDFVVPDTRSLPGHIHEWFPLLNHHTLRKYRSLIVFRA
ncbi:hypothetical protein [Desulfospira joergensenii]|uniref:hypothetical protein n=1 Tax=Desulfospira joergensenii TaxID=53329 RepID=UPI0004873119|nr:hypothetical protein [Desulfospira joergensenii]